MKPQRKKRQIEREFGVPIAGEILDPSLWTNTALKNWPAGLLDLEATFGRAAPLIVDIGCGNGRFLIGSAVWKPGVNHLGVDTKPVVIRYATRRGNQRGLSNLRFGVCDGVRLLRDHLPAGSVSEIHLYHPQPYYDAREVHKRLITPEFMVLVHRALIPGGLFFIQTDNPGYWRYIREVVAHFIELHERIGKWPDAPKGRTRREIMALRRGLPIFRGHGPAKTGLSLQEAEQIARQLPPPVFDASWELRQLDREEEA
ncbi:MAG: methyltransferase domain-containing protein [Gemmataceae bacterium]